MFCFRHCLAVRNQFRRAHIHTHAHRQKASDGKIRLKEKENSWIYAKKIVDNGSGVLCRAIRHIFCYPRDKESLLGGIINITRDHNALICRLSSIYRSIWRNACSHNLYSMTDNIEKFCRLFDYYYTYGNFGGIFGIFSFSNLFSECLKHRTLRYVRHLVAGF